MRPKYALLIPVCLSIYLLASSLQAEDAKKTKALSPTGGVIKLFNGEDLSGLYTWMKDTKYKDPRKVFTVKDGILNISGDGLGAITTRNEYTNYHAVIEFKWGKRTWGSRKKRTLDSGLLVHCVGPDGSYGGIWMASIEAQMIEGGVGDFILVGGTYADGSKVPLSMTAEVTKDRDGETVWKKGAPRKTMSSGRINWYGRDPDWKDVIGFRGKEDVDSPVGEWTRMDVICEGDTITNIVNGVVVNQGFNVFPSAGKLLIQTELAEVHVRRWELWPIGKAPAYEPTKK